jgi:dTDP-4-amino-4,6-dideoxygalactose transaminase
MIKWWNLKLGNKEKKSINQIFLYKSFSLGPVTQKLEKELEKFLNVKNVIAVNSGSNGMLLSLLSLDLKANDEIIIPNVGWISLLNAIKILNLKPILVDVEENKPLIDIDKIQKKITKKTKVIIPVHMNGRISDMNKLLYLAKKKNIYIIEDAAQAFGVKFKKKYLGTFGDIGCFSTHPLKNLNACGDGGFVLTNNKDHYLKIKKLINHGLVDRNNSETFGYVSRMDSLQAMIVMKRLDNLNYVIKKRRENAELYFEYLKDMPVVLPYELKQEYNTYHLFVIQTKNRDELIKFLKLKKIETGIHYPIPIHKQAAYKNMFKEKLDLPNTEEQANQILSLPINEFLTKNQILYICNSIKKFFE